MSDGRDVALVSGASRGIGAEIARQLAADHGFVVFAGARNPADVEERDGLVPLELDVDDDASVAGARERVAAETGRLDVLVNNAGVSGPYSTDVGGQDLADAHRILETNLFGSWRLIQAFLPLLRDSSDGRVVNMSSGAGQLSDMNTGYPAYRISKAGLNALTKILSQEEPRIRTNSVCPGWVQTDMGGTGAPRTVAEGADTAVWLATDPGVPSGGFFRDRRPIPW